MIVSHRHRFVFMKTRKTAGTSVELALSPFCGPDDILTPIGRDEPMRPAGEGARNYVLDRRCLPLAVRARLLFGAKPEAVGAVLTNHATARVALQVLGKHVWQDYFTFSIERNPWDRQASFYFWLYRNPKTRPDFETYLTDPRYRARMNNFSIYGIDGTVAVDRVLRYENLSEEFASVAAGLGLPESVTLGHAKVGSRPKGSHYSALYTPATRDLVGSWYEREIAAFGYDFDDRDMRKAS